ncbi:MAG: BTAD domain-containing putative transcriptional regulator [Solirubrobacterales bacterium]
MSLSGPARIARPALARRLCAGLEAGSVLLVAGAGYGKTMALEETIEACGQRTIWLTCAEAGSEAGRLLIDLVEALRAAVPGLADVVGEALSGSLEPVDARSAAAGLRRELEQLLVEPFVVVFDDAETIAEDEAALALVEQLLLARAPLSLAIASRRPLSLRLAKLRASGALLELGPAELSLTAGESEELLRLRRGQPVGEETVAAIVGATEGWPMGVALGALAGPLEGAEAVPRDRLFEYLAEEVLEGLDPETRLRLLNSSITDTLTPELAADLGLGDDFLGEAERSGLFLRTGRSGSRSYHPLFREFLRQRLADLRPEGELAALHERAAASLAAAGQPAEAIEHWLAAGRFEAALEQLTGAGAGLVRTSPGTVSAWLERVPEDLRSGPECRFVEAQLLWGAGRHERALEPFREAVAGFAAAGEEDRAWFARIYLADTLVFLGEYAAVSELAAGWEAVEGPIAAIAASAVAWFEVVALSCRGRREEADTLRGRLRRDPEAAGQFDFLDILAHSGFELSECRPRQGLELLRAAIAELELDDPHGRLPYALGLVLVTLRMLGERAAVPAWLERCEREAERVGLGFGLRDFRLQRASWLAQHGRLAEAEALLAQAGRREGSGWRGVCEAEAEAHVALLRGEPGVAAREARRALASAATAPMPWRVLAAVEMGATLAEAGEPDAARAALAETMAVVDEWFAGERGRLYRAWLLAARACHEQRIGQTEAACATLAAAWAEAGAETAALVRAQWPALRAPLWEALARQELAAEAAIEALQEALPGGEALIALVDHPQPQVRRAAVRTALSAGHPDLLARLTELTEDADAEVAAAAAATRERLREAPPPLRFELLGGFRVRRAGWELDEAAWQRPMAARVVRFLLVNGPGAVPEDALFEAFWADRPADGARQHLAVATSRARKVLDLPGAEQSVIEVRERTYRLALRERDSVDSIEFEEAAAAALAERGAGRRAALEAAAELWSGEPLPEDRYAAWAAPWRERLLDTQVDLLSALIETCAAAGDHDQAIRAGRRLLEVDPLNEAAHRSLMVAYARTGRTSHALRQYLECRHALVLELGVEPAAETSRLQALILAGEAL